MKECPHCGKEIKKEKPWILTKHIKEEYVIVAESRADAVAAAKFCDEPKERILTRISCVSAIWKAKQPEPISDRTK